MRCRECDRETKCGLQLCSRCGSLVGSADIIARVVRKQSQLARFGLAGARALLLKIAGLTK